MRSRIAALCCVAALAELALAGCANPDGAQLKSTSTSESSPASPGEPPAPPPASAAGETTAGPSASAEDAVIAFAERYVNWNYRTLGETERALAASAIGAARSAELQAAASSAKDPSLAAGKITNRGSVVALAPRRGDPATWVIVTSEQTSGSYGYQGLPSSLHVTLARVARVNAGYAVSEWLPQS
jgi:hypothetical protein